MRIQVGDLVQLRVGKETFRPLLIQEVSDDGLQVGGALFLMHDRDRQLPFVQKTFFYPPDADTWIYSVRGAFKGEEVGEWRIRQQPEQQPLLKATPIAAVAKGGRK